MRRCLALFLMVWLPLQSLWAVAAPYCQHEPQATPVVAQHLGHHDHGHDLAQRADTPADPGVSTDAGANGHHDHAHCHGCHGHGVALWPAAREPLAAVGPHGLNTDREAARPSPTGPRPERPNWHAFA